MRRTVAVALASWALLSLAPPAQAASTQYIPTYQRAASVEWHWYWGTKMRVWYSRDETTRLYRRSITEAAVGRLSESSWNFGGGPDLTIRR